jgi:LysR family transcriptional regulator, benzoate and cis,cis-muconate-responsive activator of ben and cat genes
MVQPGRSQLRGLRFHTLARYPFCIALAPAHPLARGRSLAIRKIATEPLIAYSRADYPEYHASLAAIFATVGRAPNIAEEHDSVTSLIAAVEAGRGIALVPSALTCMVGTRLKVLPITPAPPPIVVGAVCLKTGGSPNAQRFVDAADTEPES